MECSTLCGGHCCRRFLLPLCPEVLEAHGNAELETAADWSKDWPLPGKRYQEDVPLVAGMAIPLEPASKSNPAGPWWYACKNLDGRGLCRIYEDRPQLCRGYPYGRRCEHPACRLPMASASLTVDTKQDIEGPAGC